jgi:hypothetical protein
VQLLSSAFGRVGDVYFQTGYFLRAGYLGFSEVQDPIHIQVEFPLSATAPDPLLVITAGIVVLAYIVFAVVVTRLLSAKRFAHPVRAVGAITLLLAGLPAMLYAFAAVEG